MNNILFMKLKMIMCIINNHKIVDMLIALEEYMGI